MACLFKQHVVLHGSFIYYLYTVLDYHECHSLIKNHIICILRVICKFVMQNIFKIHILLLMHLCLTLLDSSTRMVGRINGICKSN